MKRVHLLFLLLTFSLLCGACQTRPKTQWKPSDPVGTGKLPQGSRLVAETSVSFDPLLFIPVQDGTVYYLANDDMLASFQAKTGQRVQLNAGQAPALNTEISVDDKAVFKRPNTRAGHHRFYFLPGSR